jgi:sugar/nucleoside kinase (ribokinase family)
VLDLLCLGNITIDDIALSDASERLGCLGGDAVYAGLAARLWSRDVAIIAPVGNDFAAAQFARLTAAGFDPAGLPRRAVATRHNRVTYDADSGRSWRVLTPPNDFAQLSPVTADIPARLLDTRFALVLAMDLAAQEELVAGLKRLELPVALDPQEDYIAGTEARILDMLGSVDVFLPSEIEVERLVGHRNLERAARQFAECGCAIVAMKLGARGVVVYDATADSFLRAAAAPATVIDTTGAGDSFSGGFMAVFAQSRDLAAATAAGLVAAAFAIEDFGSASLFDVTREQAAERLAQLHATAPLSSGAIA